MIARLPVTHLLQIAQIEAHVKTVFCGLCMAVVVVDSFICIAVHNVI